MQDAVEGLPQVGSVRFAQKLSCLLVSECGLVIKCQK